MVKCGKLNSEAIVCVARAYNERMEGEFGGSSKILGSFYFGGFENY